MCDLCVGHLLRSPKMRQPKIGPPFPVCRIVNNLSKWWFCWSHTVAKFHSLDIRSSLRGNRFWGRPASRGTCSRRNRNNETRKRLSYSSRQGRRKFTLNCKAATALRACLLYLNCRNSFFLA
jgi:hypothetical protein